MDNLEVEVKFLVDDLAQWRGRLLGVGAVLAKARVYERNVRLDTADDALLKKWQLLRVRQDTAVRVTFKAPGPAGVVSEVKVREELEMEVGDFDTAVLIFQRLGFAPVQVYEKYRETFRLDGVEVVLDEMPFGNFMELEGSEAGIKTAVATLDLDWDKRLVTNYLAIMADLKAHYNLPFDDITFANFADVDVSVAAVLGDYNG
ncbi:MAG: class IV adenylate cyclase [Ardenticatenaceae bacterium]|nr:class IV adenylate cyclase [Ardenticatenaceae bacterium]